MSSPTDPARCPLCGQANQCAEVAGTAGSCGLQQGCWCTQVRFPDTLLAGLPKQAVQRACICRQCQQRASTTGSQLANPANPA